MVTRVVELQTKEKSRYRKTDSGYPARTAFAVNFDN
tara:strand:- start:7378 stop:7485 length:108 start_codon:yes stop_codon:yes gene_type:complete